MSVTEREKLVADGTLTIEDACEMSGLGRTLLYSLMEQGKLRYLKVGKRRLIPRRELQRLLAECLVGV